MLLYYNSLGSKHMPSFENHFPFPSFSCDASFIIKGLVIVSVMTKCIKNSMWNEHRKK